MGASALKGSLSNTSLCSLMHQLHQSEPVKSTSRYFFSCLALAWAALKSVCQRPSAAEPPRAKARSASAAQSAARSGTRAIGRISFHFLRLRSRSEDPHGPGFARGRSRVLARGANSLTVSEPRSAAGHRSRRARPGQCSRLGIGRRSRPAGRRNPSAQSSGRGMTAANPQRRSLKGPPPQLSCGKRPGDRPKVASNSSCLSLRPTNTAATFLFGGILLRVSVSSSPEWIS